MRSTTSRNCLFIVAAAVAAFALIVPTAPAADNQAKAAAPTQPKAKAKSYPPRPKVVDLSIGDAAPDFKLPGVDGKTHALAEYKDADKLHLHGQGHHRTAEGARGQRQEQTKTPSPLLGHDRPRRRSDPHANRKARPPRASRATGESIPKITPGRRSTFCPRAAIG